MSLWKVTTSKAQSPRVMDLTKKGENGSRVSEPAEINEVANRVLRHPLSPVISLGLRNPKKKERTKEKAAEESGMRRGRIQLEPSGTSGLCPGITRHSCDKNRAVFVRQSSTAESCKKMCR